MLSYQSEIENELLDWAWATSTASARAATKRRHSCSTGEWKPLTHPQLVKPARLVDAARDQYGVSATALQAVLGLHIQQDVGHDAFQP